MKVVIDDIEYVPKSSVQGVQADKDEDIYQLELVLFSLNRIQDEKSKAYADIARSRVEKLIAKMRG